MNRKVNLENWGRGDSASTCMVKSEFISESRIDSFDFTLVANRLLVDRWQLLFEEELEIIPPPEVYKASYLITKVNRHKKLQTRWFVLSSHRLYNIDIGKKGYDPKSTKVSFINVFIIIKKFNYYLFSGLLNCNIFLVLVFLQWMKMLMVFQFKLIQLPKLKLNQLQL